MSLNRKDILESSHPASVQKVSVPEFGPDGHVYVRMLPANLYTEVMAILQTMKPGDDGTPMDFDALARGCAQLCILFVTDEDGEPVFVEADKDELLNLPLPPLQRCVEAGLDLCGMKDSSVTELEGNSASASIADSPST